MKTVIVRTAMGTFTYMMVYDLQSDGTLLLGKYNSMRQFFVHMFPLELEVYEEDYGAEDADYES